MDGDKAGGRRRAPRAWSCQWAARGAMRAIDAVTLTEGVWRRACGEAETRAVSIGATLSHTLYDTIFPRVERSGKTTRTTASFATSSLARDGEIDCRMVHAGRGEAILRVEYRGGGAGRGKSRRRGDSPADVLAAHLHVGTDWRVSIFAPHDGVPQLVVDTARRDPRKTFRDAILVFDEDWLLHDPPSGAPGRVQVEGLGDAIAVTRATHFCNDTEWSPKVEEPADTGFFSDGAVAWRSWMVGGYEVSRRGLPRFESFWPNGRRMLVEYGCGAGRLHRDPQDGPAYEEWHPDGSIALQIHALEGGVVDPNGCGVIVGIAGGETRTGRVARAFAGMDASKILELRWRPGAKGTAKGVPIPKREMHLGGQSNFWRVKRFFSRHPSAATKFPLEAAWILSPRREFLHAMGGP